MFLSNKNIVGKNNFKGDLRFVDLRLFVNCRNFKQNGKQKNLLPKQSVFLFKQKTDMGHVVLEFYEISNVEVLSAQ